VNLLQRRLVVGIVGLAWITAACLGWVTTWVNRSDTYLFGGLLVLFAVFIWRPQP